MCLTEIFCEAVSLHGERSLITGHVRILLNLPFTFKGLVPDVCLYPLTAGDRYMYFMGSVCSPGFVD